MSGNECTEMFGHALVHVSAIDKTLCGKGPLCIDRGFPTINSIPHFHVVSLFVLNWNILEAEICSTRIVLKKMKLQLGNVTYC